MLIIIIIKMHHCAIAKDMFVLHVVSFSSPLLLGLFCLFPRCIQPPTVSLFVNALLAKSKKTIWLHIQNYIHQLEFTENKWQMIQISQYQAVTTKVGM